MLWIHQRPFDGGDWPDARLHVEIVSPWRAPGVHALRRRRRARLRRLLQPGRTRRGGASAARRRLSTAREEPRLTALARRAAELELAGADEPQPAAAAATLDARPSTRPRPRRPVGVPLSPRPEDAPRALRPPAAGTTSRCRASGRCRASDSPHYTNVVMPFADLPPTRARAERDGHLPARRSPIPRGWRSRPVVLHFGGVEGVLYVAA